MRGSEELVRELLELAVETLQEILDLPDTNLDPMLRIRAADVVGRYNEEVRE